MSMNTSGKKPSSCLGRIIRFVFRFFVLLVIYNYARYMYVTRNYQPVPSKAEETSAVESAPAATPVSRAETPLVSTPSPDSSSPAVQKLSDYSITPTSHLWNTYNSSLHWFYTQLTSAEKRAYSAKYDAFALGDSSLWDTSGFGLNEMETDRVEFAFMNDCPELMFCELDFITADVVHSDDSGYFRKRADCITTKLPACLGELDKIKSTDSWGKSDLKKEQAYEKHIARKTEYLSDNNGPEGTFSVSSAVRTAYSAIVSRTAVCEGYARSTQLAMRYFDIPCIYVTGKTGKASNDNHAWNLVRIDGKWVHYDSTWNSSGKYMNLSDDEIMEKRSFSDDYSRLGFTLPVCRD